MATDKLSKNEIKEAVAESLLEALQAAEEKQKQENTSIKALLAPIVQILQVVLLPVLGYLLLQVVQLQKEIIEIRHDIMGIHNDIHAHEQHSIARTKMNAGIHHVAPTQKCNTCHGEDHGLLTDDEKLEDIRNKLINKSKTK